MRYSRDRGAATTCTTASPTADSPGYVPESNPEEEPEEDDEDPEEDPADYPADGDEDDDDDEDEDKEGEVEHPAPADSVLPIPSPPPNSPTHIEIPESCLPLRKRVRFASPTPSREVGENVRVKELDYGITDTWDDLDSLVHRRFSTSNVDSREAKMVVRLGDLSMDARTRRSDSYVISNYRLWRRVIVFQELQSERSQETEGDFRVVGIRPQETGSVD
ncbi:hypothetical protein Tco_1005826 [Tanacetum coccineum]|uniref:Uncharacterized protein n=1 Tax=Tanacetum coccineum TaxID=301880 RepID=A0ABQ5FGC3_9ASTR